MKKSFFNYIQPTIVRLSDDSEVPEALHNKYLINFNAVGIKWFSENTNVMLVETGDGTYTYMMTNDGEPLLLSNNSGGGSTGWPAIDILPIDIPRVYIVISDTFLESQDSFSEWIISAIADENVYLNGTDKFSPGVDYYLNTTLRDYFTEANNVIIPRYIFLPNYLEATGEEPSTMTVNMTKYWQALDTDTATYSNFEYFARANKLQDFAYTEDQLNSLCHTFFEVLSDGAMVSDDDMLKEKNQIYAAVVNYYKNYQTDDALANIALILNSTVSSDVSTSSTCGCQSTASTGTSKTETCYDTYKLAMSQWLIKMLGDVDFYKDWMWMLDIDGEPFANKELINALILLLENFEAAEYDLSFSNKSIYNHSCTSSTDDTTDAANHKKIQNYIMLLNWILDGSIDNNANKIKVIGEKFGELLPKLCF
jgi:hypothetical protein